MRPAGGRNGSDSSLLRGRILTRRHALVRTSCSGISSNARSCVSEMTQQGYERLVKHGKLSHSLTACRNSASCILAALPTADPSDSTPLAERSNWSPARLSSCSISARLRTICKLGNDG